MNAAVFLDRDNTLIENDGDLGDPAKVSLIRGVASAVASLKGLNYRVVVITNQGGVARGKYTEADVDAVHQKVNDLIRAISGVQVDRYYYCPYHPQGTVEKYCQEHPWRKPQPGMLLQAAKDLDLDLSQSWTVGDQMRDVEAGAAAGTRTILLAPDAEESPPLTTREIESRTGVPHFKARTLIEAVRIIAQQRKPETSQQLRDGPPRPRPPASPNDAGDSSQAATVVVKPAPREPRPFRPWTASPLDEGKPVAKRPAATPPPSAAPSPDRPSTAAAAQAAEPRSAATASRPDLYHVAASQSAASSPSTSPGRAPDDDVADEQLPPAPPINVTAESILRQILQELRNQRGSGSDFSYLKMFATVLQMVAVVCLLGGLWLGQGDIDQFIRWLGTGLLLQLGAIAMLLYQRQ